MMNNDFVKGLIKDPTGLPHYRINLVLCYCSAEWREWQHLLQINEITKKIKEIWP